MKPHLIVLDLDGTLLTDEKIISDKTKLTLKKAEEKGHHLKRRLSISTVHSFIIRMIVLGKQFMKQFHYLW